MALPLRLVHSGVGMLDQFNVVRALAIPNDDSDARPLLQ